MKTGYSVEETTMLPSHRIANHPGQILLQEFIEPLNLTQAELARALSIPLNRVNELVRGKRGITPETALLLAEYFKNSPEFWMNLQTAHDLTRALHETRNRPVAGVRGARRSMGAG
jgi:antitoxin HigA-1